MIANKELHLQTTDEALINIISEVQRTSIFVVLLMELKTKGVAHRNIEVVGYLFRCAAPLLFSIRLLCYKYYAALPLSGNIE